VSTARDPPEGDLERLATEAYLAGRVDDSARLWARAHQHHLAAGEVPRAVRCAFWLAFGLLNAGEPAQAFGWISRATRILDESTLDCVERGYLLFPHALRQIFAGDNHEAHASFGECVRIATRFGDTDLVTLARHGQGRALIRAGEVERGVALLDEAMVAVTMGEVSSIVAGDVYCSVIEACHECFDLRRAGEWTAALERWCESFPDLVAYRGSCMIRRAEIMQLQGDWDGALAEAQHARLRLADPPGQPAIGAAYYQLAELYRLRGSFEEAEKAYRDASASGRDPLPGIALLRMWQGRAGVASRSIRAALDDAAEPRRRARLLPAMVEISLAVGSPDLARAAAGEVESLADATGAPFLRAQAAYLLGAVSLAERDPGRALTELAAAADVWSDLGAAYETARTRVLMGRARRALGAEEAALLEFETARAAFERLGARPDRDAVEADLSPTVPNAIGRLTSREAEVLRQLATGSTNRTIATRLGISERTVARHVANIFSKLALSSRAEATAFAFRNDLV